VFEAKHDVAAARASLDRAIAAAPDDPSLRAPPPRASPSSAENQSVDGRRVLIRLRSGLLQGGAMRIVGIVFELLLILGGIVACSGLIVAKRPGAERILARLAPFQALIGLALIGLGVIFFVMLGPVAAFKAIKADALSAVANIGGVISAIILGFLLALPQIIRLAPNAEQRAQELAEKIIPFQLLLGLITAACGAVGLLYNLGLMSVAKSLDLAP
jgi:hypothetical protein